MHVVGFRSIVKSIAVAAQAPITVAMTIAATRGASGGDSRKDIRVVRFFALPGALAMVLAFVGVPMAMPGLLRACGRIPGWVAPVFYTIAVNAVISLFLTPFALVKRDRIPQPLDAATNALVFLSIWPALVVSFVVVWLLVAVLKGF
jgi:hypothetical protein